jgi:NADH dehydrogenase
VSLGNGRGGSPFLRRTRPPATLPSAPHRVVVVGSGFGGLSATQAMDHDGVVVTLVDRTQHHLFQPLLYQVATGILSEGEITPPTREVLSRQQNARVILGEVTDIDLEARTVTSHTGEQRTVTPYDSLVMAAGSTHSYFGSPQFAQDAPGMKSIDDALAIRGRIYGAFETAELVTDPAERMPWLTFVVVGAGPTGVEMAGQLIELSRRSLDRNFRSFDPASARVVLVEAGPRVLSTFGPTLSRRTLASLERLGVEVRLDTAVVDVDAQGVTVRSATGTERIEARTKVWAAGVRASPLGGLLAVSTETPRNRAGQLEVLADCTLRGHPEVFVIGDMMHLDVPAVAQVAIQSGRFAARQIISRVEGRPTETAFRYRDKGSLATISRFRAVASIGPLRLSGTTAWLLWLVVHLLYLVCFKNRVLVLIHWGISFLGRGRQERTAPGAPPRASQPAPLRKASS